MRLFILGLILATLCSPALVLAQPADGEGAPPDEEAELPPITKNPKLKTFVKAGYPAKAIEAEAEASVVLEIDIDAEGFVEEVRVLEPADPPGYGFDEAATDAVFQFEFEPAETAEGPIPVTITYRYNFVLAAETPPEPDATPDPEAEPGPEETPEPPAVVNYEGVLLERGTRKPLGGVTVVVFREGEEGIAGYEADTNDEGKFVFYGLELGDWKVLVEQEGYYPFRTSETIAEGEVTEVTYYVERGSYDPFDVIVEGARPRKEVNRRTITAEEIEKVPGNFGDPIKVVQNLPGVARTRFGDGRIVVRGSSPEDTRSYIGSVQVPLVYHFGGIRSVIPAGMIESIDFLPGNFSSRYGRAIGGVLDVELKRLNPESLTGYVDVNVFDAGFYLAMPIGDEVDVAIAARRSYIDSILTAVVPDGAPVNLISAPRYYDGQILTVWRPNREHELRLFVFGSDDAVEILFKNPAQVSTDLRSGNLQAGTFFSRGVLEHRWVPTADFKNRLLVATGNDVAAASLGDQFFLEVESVTVQLRNDAEWTISPEMTLVAGVDLQLTFAEVNVKAPQPNKEGDIRGRRDFTETIEASERASDGSPAAFFEFELKPWDGVLIIPGVRSGVLLPSGKFAFDPRLRARWEIDEMWAVKGGAGIYHQPPTPDETSSAFGNPDLELEEAAHYSLGAEWSPLPYLTLDTTFFFKDLRDMVARSDGVVERGGELVPEIYNNGGLGRVYGVELLLRHEFANNFFGWIAYTLSRAERLDPGDTAYRLFDFDETHNLTVVGSWRLPYNWELGVRWRLTSGRALTPVTGSIFNADADRYEQVFGPVNSDRLPLFHQLDLRVDKSWIYDTWILNVYLDVQNAYNRTNVEGFTFNYDFSEKRPQQGLPVIPALGVKASF